MILLIMIMISADPAGRHGIDILIPASQARLRRQLLHDARGHGVAGANILVIVIVVIVAVIIMILLLLLLLLMIITIMMIIIIILIITQM